MDRMNLTVNIEEQGSINITPVIETVNLKVTIDKNPVSGGGSIDSGGGSVDMDLMKKAFSARFEQNSDGDNTWTMVMPVVSGVIMNEDDTVTIQT